MIDFHLRQKSIDAAGSSFNKTGRTAPPKSVTKVKPQKIQQRRKQNFVQFGLNAFIDFLICLKCRISIFLEDLLIDNQWPIVQQASNVGFFHRSRSYQPLMHSLLQVITGLAVTDESKVLSLSNTNGRKAVANQVRATSYPPPNHRIWRSDEIRHNGTQALIESFIGIDVETPRLRALIKGELLLGSISTPWLVHEANGPSLFYKRLDQRCGTIRGPRVDDDDLGEARQTFDAGTNIRFLVKADNVSGQ